MSTSARAQGTSDQTLYVRNLNRRLPIREVKRRLELFVSRYARVAKIKMTNKPGMLGQAFVHLSEPASGDIVDRLDNRFFLGNTISVSFAHSDMYIGTRRESRAACTTRTLIVTEIPEPWTKDDVRAIFRRCAGLEEIRFIKVKSLALVDFVSVENASAAYSSFVDGLVEHDGHSVRISPSL